MRAASPRPRPALFAAAAALLAGCAATYQAPPGVATARVVVVRGESEPMRSHLIHFRAYADEECTRDIGSLGAIGMLSPDPKESAVAVGARIYVRAAGSGTEFGTNLSYRCSNLISFVPQTGGHYEFKQDMKGRGCRLQVVEKERGAAPPSFQVHALAGRCKPPV